MFVLFVLQVFEDVYFYIRLEFEVVLYYINIIFVVFFIVEMLMKWVVLGFKKYFISFWIILDFVIVVVSNCFLDIFFQI